MPEQDEKPGFFARVANFVQNDRQKWGGLSLAAHARLGLSELRQAVSLGGNVEQPTPYGMWGNITPGEIASGRQADSSAAPMDHELSQHTPGDIANDRGSVHGEERQAGNEPALTPSDIANDQHSGTESDTGQDRGQVQHADQQQQRLNRSM